MNEIWKPINGFPNYEISNLGSVKSKAHLKEKILKPFKNSKGYLYVSLPKKRTSVHKLVAETFIETKPSSDCTEINHINFNRTDNRAENLEWISHKDNIRYSMFKGNLSVKKPNNKTGHKNISWVNKLKKYRVVIGFDRKRYNIGYFKDINEALKARDKAKEKILNERVSKNVNTSTE